MATGAVMETEEIGERLLRLREERGLNPSDAARLIGMTRQGLWFLEAGKGDLGVELPVSSSVAKTIAELVESDTPQANAELQRRIQEERLTARLFGIDSIDATRPLEEPPAAAGRRSDFRRHVTELMHADKGVVADVLQLGRHTNDKLLEKAAAAVADFRGYRDVVSQYIAADQDRGELYARRTLQPTEATLNALIASYRPRELRKEELRPSKIAQDYLKQREMQKAARKQRALR